MLGKIASVPEPPKPAAQFTSSALSEVLPKPDTAPLKVIVEVPANTLKVLDDPEILPPKLIAVFTALELTVVAAPRETVVSLSPKVALAPKIMVPAKVTLLGAVAVNPAE